MEDGSPIGGCRLVVAFLITGGVELTCGGAGRSSPDCTPTGWAGAGGGSSWNIGMRAPLRGLCLPLVPGSTMGLIKAGRAVVERTACRAVGQEAPSIEPLQHPKTVKILDRGRRGVVGGEHNKWCAEADGRSRFHPPSSLS